MKNAKKIGFDIARSCGLTLGKPVCINEETSQVREGIFCEQHSSEPMSLNDLIEEKTVSVSVSIKVTFELRHRQK